MTGRMAFAALALLIAGCTTTAPAIEATGLCRPAPVQRFVGRVLDDRLTARLRKISGAQTVRTVAPGQMTTKDFRQERLTIDHDADRRITRISCG